MSDVRQRIAIVQMLDMNRPLKPQLDSIADELEAAAVWLAVSDPIDEQAIQTKALAEMNHHLAQPDPDGTYMEKLAANLATNVTMQALTLPKDQILIAQQVLRLIYAAQQAKPVTPPDVADVADDQRAIEERMAKVQALQRNMMKMSPDMIADRDVEDIDTTAEEEA